MQLNQLNKFTTSGNKRSTREHTMSRLAVWLSNNAMLRYAGSG